MKTATARKSTAAKRAAEGRGMAHAAATQAEGAGWVSLRAAAAALKVTRTKLLRFALQGELVAMEHGGRTWISEKSINQLRDKLAAATL